MRSVALLVKAITQTGIKVRSSPRFIDGHSRLFALRGNRAVHATIKVSKCKAELLEESSNTRVRPISTPPRPFNKHGNS